MKHLSQLIIPVMHGCAFFGVHCAVFFGFAFAPKLEVDDREKIL